jgi:predicted Zn-dependent protease
MPKCILIGLSVSLVLAQEPGSINKDKEAALGARLAAEFRQRTPPVDNPAIQSYVEQLGKKLDAQFSPGVTFRIAVFSDGSTDSTHEPVAFPGGYIFVSTSLLTAAQDESEVAGMLAHSMAHLANRDSARMGAHGPVINYGTVPLIFVGGWNGTNPNGAIPMGFLKTQRTFELEADQQAIRVMSAAGCDPQRLAVYISREQKRDSIFSGLPPRAERLAALQAAISEMPSSNFVASSDFVHMKEQLPATEPKRPRQVPSLISPDIDKLRP